MVLLGMSHRRGESYGRSLGSLIKQSEIVESVSQQFSRIKLFVVGIHDAPKVNSGIPVS